LREQAGNVAAVRAGHDRDGAACSVFRIAVRHRPRELAHRALVERHLQSCDVDEDSGGVVARPAEEILERAKGGKLMRSARNFIAIVLTQHCKLPLIGAYDTNETMDQKSKGSRAGTAGFSAG